MTIQRIKGVGYLNIHVSAMLLCSFNASPSPKVKLHVCPNRLNICLILAIKWHHFYLTRIRYLSNFFTESALLVVETWMMWPLLTETKLFWHCCWRSRYCQWQLTARGTWKRACSKLGDSLRIFWPALGASLAQLHQNMLTPCQSLCDSRKSLSRASNVFLKLFDVLFLQMQLVASLALLEKNLDSQFFLQFCFLFEGCL